MASTVLGKGWKFGFQFDGNGRVATTSDQSDGSTSDQGQREHIFGALTQIIMVAFGERFMRGSYGCGIFDVVFDPNDRSILSVALYFVASAIEKWEPRVELLSIDALQEGGKLKIVMAYLIKVTNEVANEVVEVA